LGHLAPSREGLPNQNKKNLSVGSVWTKSVSSRPGILSDEGSGCTESPDSTVTRMYRRALTQYGQQGYGKWQHFGDHVTTISDFAAH
jgi:hypothetical protein